MTSIFLYTQEKQLNSDINDHSIIMNDKIQKYLFDHEHMSFSEIQQLLFDKKLIMNAGMDDNDNNKNNNHPIVCFSFGCITFVYFTV